MRSQLVAVFLIKFLVADLLVGIAAKQPVTMSCENSNSCESAEVENGLENFKDTEAAYLLQVNASKVEQVEYFKVGKGYCDWHYKAGGHQGVTACAEKCKAEPHCKVFTYGTLGCRYSACGSASGPPGAACPADKQCVIATRYPDTRTDEQYEVCANHDDATVKAKAQGLGQMAVNGCSDVAPLCRDSRSARFYCPETCGACTARPCLSHSDCGSEDMQCFHGGCQACGPNSYTCASSMMQVGTSVDNVLERKSNNGRKEQSEGCNCHKSQVEQPVR